MAVSFWNHAASIRPLEHRAFNIPLRVARPPLAHELFDAGAKDH
jgi:hypothetical protein